MGCKAGAEHFSFENCGPFYRIQIHFPDHFPNVFVTPLQCFYIVTTWETHALTHRPCLEHAPSPGPDAEVFPACSWCLWFPNRMLCGLILQKLPGGERRFRTFSASTHFLDQNLPESWSKFASFIIWTQGWWSIFICDFDLPYEVIAGNLHHFATTFSD